MRKLEESFKTLFHGSEAHNRVLQEKLTQQETIIAKLTEALDFYASEENWGWDNNDISDDYELIDYAESANKIFKCDRNKGQYQDYIAGKLARKTLQEIKEME